MIDLIAPVYRESDLSFIVEKATVSVVRAPIETPVQTAFGVMQDRPALFLQLYDTNGDSGLGEVWCNFPSCGAEHRMRLLDTVILPLLLGSEFSDPAHCFEQLQRECRRLAVQTGEPGPIAQCIAGIDIALWDLVAKRLQAPLHKLLCSDQPNVGVYSSGINPTDAFETFQRCRDEGYAAFKLKIGFGDSIDFPNLERICSALSGDEQLMVDANQAWTVDEAVKKVPVLSDFPLTWLEEPILATSTDEQWLSVASASKLQLAAGENLLDERAFGNASQSAWLDVLQPDVCKWGGISGVLPVAQDALSNNKRYCPHFLGGGIGLLASAHLLAATGGDGLLEVDANPNPLREYLYSPTIEYGCTRLSEAPGLGVDNQKLQTVLGQSALSVNTIVQG